MLAKLRVWGEVGIRGVLDYPLNPLLQEIKHPHSMILQASPTQSVV